MIYGEGDYRYEEVEDWAKLPEGWTFSQVSDTAIDSMGRIYAFTRADAPDYRFRQGGEFHYVLGLRGVRRVSEPGESVARDLHRSGRRGLPDRFLAARRSTLHAPGRDGTGMGKTGDIRGDVWSGRVQHADGRGDRPGRLDLRVGWLRQPLRAQILERGQAFEDVGGSGRRSGAVRRGAQLGMHERRSRAGVRSGEQPGSDLRSDGVFIEAWAGLDMPGDVCIVDDRVYMVEQGGHGRASVWTLDGERLSWFKGSEGGVLQKPHGVCVDDEGSIYVAEISDETGCGQRLQKFARVR